MTLVLEYDPWGERHRAETLKEAARLLSIPLELREVRQTRKVELEPADLKWLDSRPLNRATSGATP